MTQLEIKDLHVRAGEKEILKGVNLKIEKGQIHAIMGPNGSGKSTLSLTIMGHPAYTVESGSILFEGTDLLSLPVHERAKRKIFLAFQYPSTIGGVSVAHFIRSAYTAQNETVSFTEFSKALHEQMNILGIDESFISRYLNDGFSGGEKKKSEILQLAMLQPRLALLDETDSGLDIDALRIVSEGINRVKNEEMSILLVTHYQRILNYIKPDVVHVMYDGRIIESGDSKLAARLETEGYEDIIKQKGQ